MTILEAFDKYVESGIDVLPTRKDKSPALKKNETWRDTIDKKLFNDSYGIGIKCGEVSANLEGLDFDNKFGDIKRVFKEYLSIPEVQEIYRKYKLPVVSTQSGGFHLLYRCNVIGGNQKLARKLNDKGKPITIIETRGEGGYVVGYPTPGYEVIRNDIFFIDVITEEERSILIESAMAFNEYIPPERKKAIPHNHRDSERPGDFFDDMPDSVDSMISSLKSAGWVHVSGKYWRRPGKDKGISATLGYIAPNIFYNFSADAHPFEPLTCYTPFQVISILEHGEDFSSFAKEIKEKYMDDLPKLKSKKKDESVSLLDAAYLDPNKKYNAPPTVMEINHRKGQSSFWKRLITLGNISCIQGKAKSKKTFLMSLFEGISASSSSDSEFKIRSNKIQGKDIVLVFDTEQADYDVYKVQNTARGIAGESKNSILFYTLREYDPKERLDIIIEAMEKYGERIKIMFIDGIADLVDTINDEKVAKKIVSFFMAQTKKYNIHVCFVLHEGRHDKMGMGWIGTEIMRKSELVISVEKDKENPSYSVVGCEYIRGVEQFEPFAFYINDDGVPTINLMYKSEGDLF